MDHYQCYRVWIPATHAERIADTIQFFLTILCTPNLSHHDASLQAARKLTHTLQNLTTPSHCHNCLTTNCEHYISSALSFVPALQGWSTIHHQNHPRVPLLPLNHATTCVLDLPIHRRHHPQVLVLPLNHATTCVRDLTTPPHHPRQHRQIYGIPRPPCGSHHL